MTEMFLTQKQEDFSRAYVRAVVAAAGLRYSEPSPDDDSVDLTVAERGLNGTVRSPKLDIQLKCTMASSPIQALWHYDLPIKKL